MVIDTCAICDTLGVHLGFKDVYNKYDSNDVSGKSYGVKRTYEYKKCPKCEYWWVADPNDDYEKMYEDDYWGTHQSWRGWPTIFTDERLNNDKKYGDMRIPDIKKYIKTGKVLEVACSTGRQLKALKDNGFYLCHGQEVNKDGVKIASEYTGCYIHPKILTGNEPEIPNDYYDLLVHLDVIEHVLYPQKQLEIWCKKVKVGGFVFQENPDAGCNHARNHVLDWDHSIPAEHINYFTKEHVCTLYKRFGFEILEASNVYTTDRMRIAGRKVKE